MIKSWKAFWTSVSDLFLTVGVATRAAREEAEALEQRLIITRESRHTKALAEALAIAEEFRTTPKLPASKK